MEELIDALENIIAALGMVNSHENIYYTEFCTRKRSQVDSQHFINQLNSAILS